MRDWIRCLLLIFGFLTVITGPGWTKSYPRDGNFKEFTYRKDKWYYVDKSWYVRSPDKWVHFMGSRALVELGHKVTGEKTWATIIACGLGVLKEVDDSYREGWSRRDLYMDFGGVASYLIMPKNTELLAYYDSSAVIFRFSYILR